MKIVLNSGKLLLACLAGMTLLQASDFTGVYARIDKVVLEPSAESPERVQIWGVFAIAQPNDRNYYQPAARGYLYYKLAGNPQAARNEWNDLKQLAGGKEIVAFGTRAGQPKLRKAADKPADPDPYVTNVGVQKVNGRTDYEPIRALLDFKD